MQKLQLSMNAYVKWLGQREGLGEREKGAPAAVLGRTMVHHGEDFDTNSEFGNCLIGTSCPSPPWLLSTTANLSTSQLWVAPTSESQIFRSSIRPMPQPTGWSRSRDLLL